jgi:hypothetical protein
VHLSSGHASHGQDRSEHLNRPLASGCMPFI